MSFRPGHLLGATSALLPAAALAHDLSNRYGPLLGALLHPLMALDHALALLAVGLIAGQQDRADGRYTPAAFLIALPAGAAGGMSGAIPEAVGAVLGWINVGSVPLLGALVALGVAMPRAMAMPIAAFVGLSHGGENGLDIGAHAASFAAVLGVTLAGAIAALPAAGLAWHLPPGWPRVAVRVIGSRLAAIGLIMLAPRCARPERLRTAVAWMPARTAGIRASARQGRCGDCAGRHSATGVMPLDAVCNARRRIALPAMTVDRSARATGFAQPLTCPHGRVRTFGHPRQAVTSAHSHRARRMVQSPHDRPARTQAQPHAAAAHLLRPRHHHRRRDLRAGRPRSAGYAGLYAPVAFLLAALLATFTGISYAELAARYPKSAGEAVYVQEGLQRRALSVLVGLSDHRSPAWCPACHDRQRLRRLPARVRGRAGRARHRAAGAGARGAGGLGHPASRSSAATVITLIEVGGLLFIVVVAGDSLADAAGPPGRSCCRRLDAGVWHGILLGAFLAFYAFIGFEDMVNVAEEVRDPTRDAAARDPAGARPRPACCTCWWRWLRCWPLPPAELAQTRAPLADDLHARHRRARRP
ncbi:MAG: HupE/UreJ family protein [Chromatiales bacterium]|nr:HupE/UreJ family protein [Chromatiales bacterium]